MDPRAIGALTIVLDSQGDRSPEPSEALALRILTTLEAHGFVLLDECARCHEDPRAHWCADLEETFN